MGCVARVWDCWLFPGGEMVGGWGWRVERLETMRYQNTAWILKVLPLFKRSLVNMTLNRHAPPGGQLQEPRYHIDSTCIAHSQLDTSQFYPRPSSPISMLSPAGSRDKQRGVSIIDRAVLPLAQCPPSMPAPVASLLRPLHAVDPRCNRQSFSFFPFPFQNPTQIQPRLLTPGWNWGCMSGRRHDDPDMDTSKPRNRNNDKKRRTITISKYNRH
ncbi:hypothetical protein QBC39DRAFT_100784 [Podospora conica]|nr:hypothetical protein QBC39DRAFT_100784 [Schizothecium conicum]